MAIDRDKPKQKLRQSQLEAKEAELSQAQMSVRRMEQRLKHYGEELERVKAAFREMHQQILEFMAMATGGHQATIQSLTRSSGLPESI